MTKKVKQKAHNRSCEIIGFGVCTCDFWESADEKAKLKITDVHERLAGILATCREHSNGFDILKHIENLALGKEQYVPPSRR